jgi:hypothetical protein
VTTKPVTVTSLSLERNVREMLAEKISGTHVGLWFLVPEHLRLGSWDLLKAWTGHHDNQAIEPHLALQMVHESALCANGVRDQRTLRHKGFEALNGLPFVATDLSIHRLLNSHTMAEAESLQRALGQLRRSQGHYNGAYILIDPHRIYTWSKRDMAPKKANRKQAVSRKVLQTFFATDGDTGQPFSFGMGSSAVTINQATLPLLRTLETIVPNSAVCVLDAEHYTADILSWFITTKQLQCLMPAPRRKSLLRHCSTLPFKPLWPGYAVAETSHQLQGQAEPIRLVVQRTGERHEAFDYKPFGTTSHLPADELMTLIFPERWNIEEFFNTQSALGWNRASTLNLNIRFGRLSMALIAQAVIYQLRQKLPIGIRNCTAETMAKNFFKGIDGDIRVRQDTIVVTCYNAPEVQFLKEQYEHLPRKLEAENINPRVPWLYNFKVDFRFK